MPKISFNFQRLVFQAFESLLLILLLSSFLVTSLTNLSFAAKTQKNQVATTVYDSQPPTSEKELLKFLDLLPKFRAWARSNKEEAHPSITHSKPDFSYSKAAATWVKANGFEPRRFFCVMGRMAAALVIVAEGYEGTRPKDMPTVTDGETALVRKHLAKMLQASGASADQKPLQVKVSPPTLPKR